MLLNLTQYTKEQSLKNCKFARLKLYHCNDKVIQTFSLLEHYMYSNQNLY